jgi:hypothetical protein
MDQEKDEEIYEQLPTEAEINDIKSVIEREKMSAPDVDAEWEKISRGMDHDNHRTLYIGIILSIAASLMLFGYGKKKTFIASLFLFLLLNVAGARAQGNNVTFDCNDMALTSALSKVESQCAYYKINYNYDDLSKVKVTATIKSLPAPEAVKALLAGLPFVSR